MTPSPSRVEQHVSLELKKSIGLDNLGSKALKTAAPIIAGPITQINNMSISKCCFLRLENCQGDPTILQNYRHISILPILSKVIERHVSNSLYTYIHKNDLIDVNQSGFRAHHSCETALLIKLKTGTQT